MDYYAELSVSDVTSFISRNVLVSVLLGSLVSLAIFYWWRSRSEERFSLWEICAIMEKLFDGIDETKELKEMEEDERTEKLLQVYTLALQLNLLQKKSNLDIDRVEKLALRECGQRFEIVDLVTKMLCYLFPDDIVQTKRRIASLTRGQRNSVKDESLLHGYKKSDKELDRKKVKQEEEEDDFGVAPIRKEDYGLVIPVYQLIVKHCPMEVVLHVTVFRLCNIYSEDTSFVAYLFRKLEKRFKGIEEEEAIELFLAAFNMLDNEQDEQAYEQDESHRLVFWLMTLVEVTSERIYQQLVHESLDEELSNRTRAVIAKYLIEIYADRLKADQQVESLVERYRFFIELYFEI